MTMWVWTSIVGRLLTGNWQTISWAKRFLSCWTRGSIRLSDMGTKIFQPSYRIWDSDVNIIYYGMIRSLLVPKEDCMTYLGTVTKCPWSITNVLSCDEVHRKYMNEWCDVRSIAIPTMPLLPSLLSHRDTQAARDFSRPLGYPSIQRFLRYSSTPTVTTSYAYRTSAAYICPQNTKSWVVESHIA